MVSRLGAWLKTVLGQRCQLCLAVISCPEHFPLCPTCQKLLAPRPAGYCPRCGICGADAQAPPSLCPRCRTAPPPWSALAFHSPYAGTLRDLIHRHKFGHELGLGRVLTLLVRQTWDLRGLDWPDRITPVPMLPRRIVQRGFNQSAELAKMLGSYLGLPSAPLVLRKVRNTSPQSTLGRAARLHNLDRAFEAEDSLAGQHVLLVDDVATTGATLHACADACLRAGAVQVDAFVLARAL